MNETYYGAPNDFRGYLQHHGIKGQKWGVRNGPPYPLDASDHSAAEKKAAKGGSKKLSTSTSDISKKKATPSKSSILRNKKVAGGMTENKQVVEEKPDTEYIKNRRSVSYQNKNIAKKNDLDDLKEFDEDGFIDGYGSKIEDKIQDAAFSYIYNLNKHGQEYADKELHEALKDYSYKLTRQSEVYDDDEEPYDLYSLKVEGNEIGYFMPFEEDYSDEEYFYKVKEK